MQTRKYRVEKRRDLQLSRASHLRLSPKALCTKENDCPPIGHDSWLGWAKPPKREVKAEVLSVVLQLCDNDHENIRAEAVHLQKWKRFTKGSDPSAPLDHSVPTVWLQNSKPRFASACLAPASQSKADPRADSKVVPLVSGETATERRAHAGRILGLDPRSAQHPREQRDLEEPMHITAAKFASGRVSEMHGQQLTTEIFPVAESGHSG